VPRQSESTLTAIKHAVDIVALIGEYLPLHRAGAKFKALCPFHDDHTPSLEINPDRQSYKCWSCGAGGDIFDFTQNFEKIEFPEALRMLAERAGVALDTPDERAPAPAGASKTELLAATAWAAAAFAEALPGSAEARHYVAARGISAEAVARFGLGFAPDARDWLSLRARRAGIAAATLDAAGLIARSAENPNLTRDRFRGRLIFPIRDPRGRPVAFGGRILPDAEQKLLEAGHRAAKYLNSPETPIFQKRRTLYAADLARDAARKAGWVAVVEGYTDVIAAHQVGLANVVGTLGTALGDDHVAGLRRLADRVVLIFDGDEAGQKAADRALEIFLGHEIDVRVLSLPDDLDPADFLMAEGADAFAFLVGRAVDPLAFALERAAARFDFGSVDGARRAAEAVLAVLARVPRANRVGLDVKVDKALHTLAMRLGVSVGELRRLLKQEQGRRQPRPAAAGPRPEPGAAPAVSAHVPIRVADLNPLDRELAEVVLNEPSAVAGLITRVTPASLRDAPLRAILGACYDLHAEGIAPDFEHVSRRLTDPAVRSLAAGLLLPMDPAPLPEGTRPAPWGARLEGVLARLAERERQDRLRDLEAALNETDRDANPADHQALWLERFRLLAQRPDARKKTAS